MSHDTARIILERHRIGAGKYYFIPMTPEHFPDFPRTVKFPEDGIYISEMDAKLLDELLKDENIALNLNIQKYGHGNEIVSLPTKNLHLFIGKKQGAGFNCDEITLFDRDKLLNYINNKKLKEEEEILLLEKSFLGSVTLNVKFSIVNVELVQSVQHAEDEVAAELATAVEALGAAASKSLTGESDSNPRAKNEVAAALATAVEALGAAAGESLTDKSGSDPLAQDEGAAAGIGESGSANKDSSVAASNDSLVNAALDGINKAAGINQLPSVEQKNIKAIEKRLINEVTGKSKDPKHFYKACAGLLSFGVVSQSPMVIAASCILIAVVAYFYGHSLNSVNEFIKGSGFTEKVNHERVNHSQEQPVAAVS